MKHPVILALLAFTPFGLLVVRGAETTAKRAPNVIVILADDLGYGDVSCYGQGKIKTPHIDSLATDGIRLTDGYASSSTCTPTRYSLLTGEYAWRKKGTGILPGDAALIISPSRVTLPRIFQKAGYVTGAIGKWHLGLGDGKVDFNTHITPGLNEVGFDYSFNMAATGDRVPCVYMENGRVVNLDPKDPITVSYTHKVGDWPTLQELRGNAPAGEIPAENRHLVRMDSDRGHADTVINGIGRIGFMTGGKAALWDDQTLSDTFNGKAIGFIKKNKSRPFFLYYAAHEPHVPRDPNPRFVGKSGLGARGDAVLQFDDEVGRLLATLKAEGLENDTLVILSSDNGPAVADGYADGALPTETKAGHHASGNFRGGKYGNFEGGVRMPFLARWPGHIKPGSVSAEPVALTDLSATAAALTGRPLDADTAPDSLNFLPVLTGGGKSPHEFLLFGNPQPKHLPSAIREGKWKLILGATHAGKIKAGAGDDVNVAAAKKAAGQGAQLFDLENDAGENKNVAAANPDIVRRLTARALAAAAAGFTRPGAQKVDIR